MIQLKTMKHIATSRAIPSIRSVPALGRSHHCLGESGRITAGQDQTRVQNARRIWLNHQWKKRH